MLIAVEILFGLVSNLVPRASNLVPRVFSLAWGREKTLGTRLPEFRSP